MENRKVKMKNIRSFFIVGIMLVMVACLSGCKQDKQEEYETEMIYIYLEDGISKEEINTIETELNSIEGVKKVKYISKKDALQLAKDKLGEGNEDLLNHYTDNNHPFPACYEVIIEKQKDYKDIVNKIRLFKGVKDVRAPETN